MMLVFNILYSFPNKYTGIEKTLLLLNFSHPMLHVQVPSSATLYTAILETAQTKLIAVIEQSSTIQAMEVINLELKDFNKMNKKESLQGGRTKRQNSSFSIKSHTLYALGNNKFNSQLINSLPPESTFEMTHNCHTYKPRVSKSRVALPHAAQCCCGFSLPARTNTISQAVSAPLRSQAHGPSHPRTQVQETASQQLHAHKQLLQGGQQREQHRAMFLGLGQIFLSWMFLL